MFIEKPASKNSFSNRKLVCGVGINDAAYFTKTKIDGVIERCPYYLRWKSMLARCYSSQYQSRQPTYKGCTVCNEWLTFSNFKSWMEKQEWQGMELDKDLISPKNKLYSPEFCVFIPQSLNKVLSIRNSNRKNPQGVFTDRKSCKFKAVCQSGGIINVIGYFDTAELAESAYNEFKSNYIKEVAKEYISNTRLYNGLVDNANILSSS